MSFRPKAQRPPVPLLGDGCPHFTFCNRWSVIFFLSRVHCCVSNSFVHAGANSQLVSNPCSDILVCLCENSLYFSKAEEAEVENEWNAAKFFKKDSLSVRTKLVNCLRADLINSAAVFIPGNMSFEAIWITKHYWPGFLLHFCCLPLY